MNRVGGNHWTFIAIEIKNACFVYMDPKGYLYTDLTACHKYCQMWQVFMTIFNKEHGGNTWLPTSYSSTVFPHARQPVNDNKNCYFVTCHHIVSCTYILLSHIYVISFSSSFFKFTKHYLECADMSDMDPETHGPAIAAEILDCSSLTTECITYAKKCDGSQPFRICEGYYIISTCKPDTTSH